MNFVFIFIHALESSDYNNLIAHCEQVIVWNIKPISSVFYLYHIILPFICNIYDT